MGCKKKEYQLNPFSKDADQRCVMFALRAMEKGGEMKSNKVNKDHLSTIIKVIITFKKLFLGKKRK